MNKQTQEYDYEGLEIKKRDLKDELTALEGENKENFLDFMYKALTWGPKKRIRAADMFLHPWIQALHDLEDGYHLDENGRVIE